MCARHVVDLFSVGARVRNHFHLHVLEAGYIKLHSPACFVKTKEICESIVFGVNITPLPHMSNISNVSTFL